MNRVLFSCEKQQWATPQELYAKLHEEFSFNYDPCPLSPTEDHLIKSWAGTRAFINPPYDNILAFLGKYAEPDVAVYLLAVSDGDEVVSSVFPSGA